jgi:hypothetical protein
MATPHAAAKPPLDVAALVSRATISKLLARQRLRELTLHHKQVEQQLRQLEARGYSAPAAKRCRDEETGVAPTAEDGAEAADAGRMDVDGGGGAAPKRARREGDADAAGAAAGTGEPAPAGAGAAAAPAQSEASAKDGATRQRPSPRVSLTPRNWALPA